MRFKMPEGFKVEFEHRQFAKPMCVILHNADNSDFRYGRIITPRGYTYCKLLTSEGLFVAEGIAWCRDTDQFNKSIGRQIAQGRALKAFETGTQFQSLNATIRPKGK